MYRNDRIMDKEIKTYWLNHFLNFLAVCLGIAITFGAQGLIDAKNEKKEVVSSLTLVKNELEDNITYIQFADSVLAKNSQAALFLLRYESNYEDAPADSMAMYCNVPLTEYEVTYSGEALELLKTSSIFTKIKDMELSLEIIHTYGIISDQMKVIKFIFDRKGKYFDDALTPNVKNVLAGDKVTAAGLWNAITQSNEGKQFLRELYRLQVGYDSSAAIQSIREAINKIDAYILNQ